ncbi:hypothetical protein [Enhygromyxa salina]|nr:hypothetical protein [Enhygromyxa salina]
MTQSRTGAWRGGIAVAIVSAVALGVGLWTANLLSPTAVLAPFATIVVCIGLATILGGLAGALAFALNSKGLMQQLRTHVDRREPVALVLGSKQLPLGLAKFRPISVGVIN